MPPKDAEVGARITGTSGALYLDPKLKVAAATRQFGGPYERLLWRRKGRPPSSSHGGHLRKLIEPKDGDLKSYLLTLDG